MPVEFREAINRALAEELERDQSVILLGEDVGDAGGVFKVTVGLQERFGPQRVIDTPISELALSGAAFGSAITGMRPVLEIMFGDFMALPMDALVNQSAKYWYLSNDARSVPLVVRTAVGAGGRFGAVHSQNPGTWLHGVPGLKVVCPSRPTDAYGLLKQAIRDPNPVVFLEHKRLYSTKGEINDDGATLGSARVARPGTDVTAVSLMAGVPVLLEAAEMLDSDRISLEVVDLTSLRPLDTGTVAKSVSKTGRMLAVEEGTRTGGWAAGLLGALAVEALDLLEDAWLLNSPDHPIPFSPKLECAFVPDARAVAKSVRERLNGG